jgi:hypothetical protein
MMLTMRYEGSSPLVVCVQSNEELEHRIPFQLVVKIDNSFYILLSAHSNILLLDQNFAL